MKIKVNGNEIEGIDNDVIKIVSEIVSVKKQLDFKKKDNLLFNHGENIRPTPLMKEER